MRRLVLVAALAVAVLGATGETAAAAPPGKAKIWFAPLPPDQPGSDASFVGSVDFLKLFSPSAPWQKAARRVDVFKLYGGWIARGAKDSWLRSAVADLKRRRIALAVEEGPLLPTEDCGLNIEGFAGEEGVAVAQRVKDAGGQLRYLAFDEPFFYASIYDGPRACHWSADLVARGIADYIEGIRQVFPGIRFGDTEPLTSSADVALYEEWIDVYERVVGEKLAFLHLDVGYYLPNWPELARELETFARSRGVPFGIIYMGEPQDTADAAWLARAQERFETYETEAGGQPDHAVLQSWHDRPDYVLPESNPARFTSLVNRYARARTKLSVRLSGGDVTGRLADARGRPMPGARVSLGVVPRYEGALAPAEPLLELTVKTDADGAFRATVPAVSLGVLVQARYAGSKTRWPAYAAVAMGSAGRNVALGRPVTVSEGAQGSPGLAVDGSYDTIWAAGDDPPQWIEIDLGGPASIGQVRLVTEQYPVGETHHVVLGRGADGSFRVLVEFQSPTDSGQLLEHTPATPWTGISAIRVETRSGPSWVAWREIEVWSWDG